MTLVSLPSPIAWPGIIGNLAGGPSMGNVGSLTSAGHYICYVFCARENMVISHVGFRCTASSSGQAIVTIETLDATGFPNGAGFGSSASAATALTVNTNPVIALGASATITNGQVFAVKIAYSSGTSFNVGSLSNHMLLGSSVLPYLVLNTGTPAKGGLNGTTTISLGSSSTTFYQVPQAFPVDTISAPTFNNTNSAKRGLKFTIPFNCRAIGIKVGLAGSTGDFNYGLYTGDASGTELSSSSTALDGDVTAGTTPSHYLFFDNPVTLTAGTTYRIALEPTSATNVGFNLYTIPTNHFSACPAGLTAVYSTLVSGTWTDSTTQLPLMDVLVDQIDNGSGTGASSGVIGG